MCVCVNIYINWCRKSWALLFVSIKKKIFLKKKKIVCVREGEGTD